MKPPKRKLRGRGPRHYIPRITFHRRLMTIKVRQKIRRTSKIAKTSIHKLNRMLNLEHRDFYYQSFRRAYCSIEGFFQLSTINQAQFMMQEN